MLLYAGNNVRRRLRMSLGVETFRALIYVSRFPWHRYKRFAAMPTIQLRVHLKTLTCLLCRFLACPRTLPFRFPLFDLRFRHCDHGAEHPVESFKLVWGVAFGNHFRAEFYGVRGVRWFHS